MAKDNTEGAVSVPGKGAERLLTRILSNMLATLQESEHFDEPLLARIRSLGEEGSLSDKDAVTQALTSRGVADAAP
jgi:hypothetical protein